MRNLYLGWGYDTSGMFRVGPLALDSRHVPGQFGWAFGLKAVIYGGSHLASVMVGLGPFGGLYTEVYRWQRWEWER